MIIQIVNEIQEIYRRQRKIKKFEISVRIDSMLMCMQNVLNMMILVYKHTIPKPVLMSTVTVHVLRKIAT